MASNYHSLVRCRVATRRMRPVTVTRHSLTACRSRRPRRGDHDTQNPLGSKHAFDRDEVRRQLDYLPGTCSGRCADPFLPRVAVPVRCRRRPHSLVACDRERRAAGIRRATPRPARPGLRRDHLQVRVAAGIDRRESRRHRRGGSATAADRCPPISPSTSSLSTGRTPIRIREPVTCSVSQESDRRSCSRRFDGSASRLPLADRRWPRPGTRRATNGSSQQRHGSWPRCRCLGCSASAARSTRSSTRSAGTRRSLDASSRATGFDRSVHLQPGVGGELIRLAPLLRPLIERLWASRVIVYNRLPEGRLDEFLFRRARLDAVRLRLALFELQDGRCFYTDRPLRPNEADVDHFLPWSRSPLNAVENLVIADRRINNNKRDHLADADHVARWCRPQSGSRLGPRRWSPTPTAGRPHPSRHSASHGPSTSRSVRRTCCGPHRTPSSAPTSIVCVPCSPREGRRFG